MTSVYLTAAGWKIAYVPQTVQWGLVPDTVRKHHNQHTRWTAAFIYSIFALFSDRTKGQATFQQRAGAAIPSIVIVFSNAIIGFSAVAIPYIAFTGSQTVAYQSLGQLRNLLLLELLSFLAALLSGITRSRSIRTYGHVFLDWEQVGVAPFQAATIIRTTLSELLGFKLQSFAPSFGPIPSDKPSRFRSFCKSIGIELVAHLFILAIHLAGGFVGLRTIMAAAKVESLAECLFSRAGYPVFFLLWGKYVLQSGIPIPTIVSSRSIWPVRESLLIRDAVSKVAYPSEEAISPKRTKPAQKFVKFAICYHCIVLVSLWGLQWKL